VFFNYQWSSFNMKKTKKQRPAVPSCRTAKRPTPKPETVDVLNDSAAFSRLVEGITGIGKNSERICPACLRKL
jgi:hypothetical protein